MAQPHVVLVRREGAKAPGWQHAAAAVPLLVRGPALAPADRAALADAECALVDGADADPVGLARMLHASEPALQVVIVAAHGERPAIERALLFGRAGEVWIVPPGEVGPALGTRAAQVTRQRRSYRTTHARLEHDLSLFEPHAARRAVVSDAYLAALLGVLPDPVISVDDQGTVLSWNAAAERVLGPSRQQAVGRPLGELLGPAAGNLLDAMEAGEPGEPLRMEIGFRRRAGDEGVAEVVVTTVRAAGHRVRSVVLHDVTESRRVQADLEAQATELEAQAAELEMAGLELETSNDELRRANEELAEQTRQAEEANRAKTEFLSAMSHELRTPLNAIAGYVELIVMGIRGPVTDEQKADLERIRRAQRHLLSLINDVLNFAKVEAGHLEIAREAVPVAALVEEIEPLIGPQRSTKGLAYHCAAGDRAVRAWGDAERIRQILLNLVTNAAKFTPPGGRIEVAVEAGAQHVHVRVADTGRGIPPDRLKSIFDPFVQIDRQHTEPSQQGVGLGLAISRELARGMGGEITATSVPGEGSTFTLTLPRAPEAPPADG
ncbi:MAG TPA: PAS domain-containing sensor histidine kinase [Longimicrobium sp.]|nr:PAS domain-containing sensor histidine kinase [Longimicrobium sp.]